MPTKNDGPLRDEGTNIKIWKHTHATLKALQSLIHTQEGGKQPGFALLVERLAKEEMTRRKRRQK